MKKNFLVNMFILFCIPHICNAQDSKLPQNFLFDDSDIIIKASIKKEDSINVNKDAKEALNSARKLLNTKPTKLQKKKSPSYQKPFSQNTASKLSTFSLAPFGLFWDSSIIDTQSQGVKLTKTDMKDYVNSFIAEQLPKPIDFFNKIYVVYGQEDKLYRILAYSKLIDDSPNAEKILKQYFLFSQLLEKKYGNKEETFIPAVINKTIKNAQGKEETIQEPALIGNSNFLSQLQQGTATLFSTYNNNNVAAALSIGVDDNKKSYIVIDYKNLRILKEQEAQTLDAL